MGNALTANSIDPTPYRLIDLIRIGITLSCPVTTSKGLADILHIIADVAIGIHLAFHMNVTAHLAEVTATALRHRIGEAQARSRLYFWQILGDDLFLKRNGCSGDDQRLMLFHRQGDQRQTIPECFPCPRTGLNNPDAILLLSGGSVNDCAAKRHHVYLPGTRGQTLCVQEEVIGSLSHFSGSHPGFIVWHIRTLSSAGQEAQPGSGYRSQVHPHAGGCTGFISLPVNGL